MTCPRLTVSFRHPTEVGACYGQMPSRTDLEKRLSLHVHLIIVVIGGARVAIFALFAVAVLVLLFPRRRDFSDASQFSLQAMKHDVLTSSHRSLQSQMLSLHQPPCLPHHSS